MGKLVKFEVKQFSAARVIGKQVIHGLKSGTKNPVPELWESMARDGILDYLKNMHERATQAPDTVGWMGDFNPETREFVYLAGVLTKPGTPVPEGYAYRDIPDCEMSIGWMQGSDDNGDVYQGASECTAKARKEHGYEYDGSAGGFEMEYYSHARFYVPFEQGEKELIMDFYSPCRKRAVTEP